MSIRDTSKMFIFKEEFIQKLDDNPVEALQEVGIEPTGEMLEALGGLDKRALMQLAEAFVPREPGYTIAYP